MADVTSKGADAFVKSYYMAYDSQRHALAVFYKEAAAIVWNGNPLAGIKAYQEFYLKLPVSNHEIQSYDAQPLLGDGTANVIVTVTGTLRYANTQARPFSQTFVLMPSISPETGKKTHQVASDIFRFI